MVFMFIVFVLTMFYFLALFYNKISVVDIGWGVGLALSCFFSFLTSKHLESSIPLVLIVLWGTRLATYLLIRARGVQDDRRYLEIAKKWKGSFRLNLFFRIFMVQAIMQFIVGLFYFTRPSQLMNFSHPIVVLGLVVAVFGLLYESVADFSLYKFKKYNKGLCNTGLWKFSRHPNYFGEILFWWGLYLIIYPGLFHWQIISPFFLMMTILKVSGPPMIESKYHRDDNPSYYNKNSIVPDLRLLFKK